MLLPSNLDGKTISGDLTSESPKDKPWTNHRGQADALQVLLATTELETSNYSPEKWAIRMFKCSQSLHFNVTESETAKTYKLHKAEFCRVPICPICTWRRSMKWRARLIEGFTKLVQAYPDHQYLFLTLTIRNCPMGELRAKIGAMVKGWDRLRKRQEFPAVGYVRSLEVTRNSDTGECHPHFHCLLMVSKSYFTGKYYLSQDKWTELWKQSMKLDYVPIVDVRKVSNRKKKEVNLLEGQGEIQTDLDTGILGAILETAKYSVKTSDLLADPDWMIQLADQLYRVQKTVTGGLIRNFINDKEDDDDLIHITADPETISEADYILIFDWWQVVKKYLPRDE